MLDARGVQARLLVDGMNVIGSRPDGWWRDREGAMRALVAELSEYAAASGRAITLVLDGRPRPGVEAVSRASGAAVTVMFAPGGPGAADDEIARLAAADPDPASLTVVSSDAALARR
ncbi:MAG: NYN domain-containing protein, partial [Acidimicrobiales bacterium]|nr:NYN domain-containing protein [Acidimicrobiales bacterium]